MGVKYVVAIILPESMAYAMSFNTLREAEEYAEEKKDSPAVTKIHIRRVSVYEGRNGEELVGESEVLAVWVKTIYGWFCDYP